jgi:hypothetical protein
MALKRMGIVENYEVHTVFEANVKINFREFDNLALLLLD